MRVYILRTYYSLLSFVAGVDLYTHVTNDKAKTEMNKLEDLYEAII